MRRIAIGLACSATLLSGCLSASRRLGAPERPEHTLANPAGADPSLRRASAEAGDAAAGPRISFHDPKAVSNETMFGNAPESSYRDAIVP